MDKYLMDDDTQLLVIELKERVKSLEDIIESLLSGQKFSITRTNYFSGLTLIKEDD